MIGYENIMRPATVDQPSPQISPLMLSDHLITLAKQAGHAGYRDAAHRLVTLACQLLEQAPLSITTGPSAPITPVLRNRRRRASR